MKPASMVLNQGTRTMIMEPFSYKTLKKSGPPLLVRFVCSDHKKKCYDLRVTVAYDYI